MNQGISANFQTLTSEIIEPRNGNPIDELNDSYEDNDPNDVDEGFEEVKSEQSQIIDDRFDHEANRLQVTEKVLIAKKS